MAVRLFRASPCGSVRAPQGGVRSVQFRASPCVPSRGVSGVVLGTQKGLTELCVIDVGDHYRGRVVILRIDVGICVPTWFSLSTFFFATTSVSMFVFFRRHICVNVLSMVFGYVLGLAACSAFSCLKLCGGVCRRFMRVHGCDCFCGALYV